MSHLFDIAACMAQKKAMPKPQIRVMINMAGGGGLPSLKKNVNINGQPHKLSYINNDEATLLQQLGGSGRMVNGIPAYYYGDGYGQDWDEAESAAAAASSDVGSGTEGGMTADEAEGTMGGTMDWALNMGPITTAYMGTPDDPQSALNKSKTTSWLNTFLSMLANKVAAVSPFGMVPNLVAHLTTGRSIGELAFDEKDPSQVGTETIAGWLGGKSRSEYDHMDPDEMSTDVHDVDHPSFDEDTMSEDEFITAEEAAKKEDAKNIDSAMKGYFTATGEETTEPWWDTLTENQQDMLIQAFGPDVAKKGLPDIMKQVYGNRGTA